MKEKITDTQLQNMEMSGKTGGEGVDTPSDAESVLNKFKNAGSVDGSSESDYGPELEILQEGEDVKPEDPKPYSEEQITLRIIKEWGENEDSLIATKAVLIKNSSGLIVTETFDSLNIPEGLEKVSYQFCRKGEYEGESFASTAIYRFRYRKPTKAEVETNYNAFMGIETDEVTGSERGTLIAVGDTLGVLGVSTLPDDKPVKREGVLGKNETVDQESGLIVVFDSVKF